MLGAQFDQADVAAHLAIQAEHDAASHQPIDAPRDDVLFQFEVRNAVGEQAARAVIAVVDGDAVAALAQALGGRQTGGPRADDAGGFGARLRRRERLHPTLLPRGLAQIFLDGADGDGAVPRLLDDAASLAQTILWTDASAHFRHRVGRLRKRVRLFEAAFGGELQPVGDVIRERTMHLAERDAALRATRGLFGRLGRSEGGENLPEVRAPFGRRALLGQVPRCGNKTLHSVYNLAIPKQQWPPYGIFLLSASKKCAVR